MKKFLAALLILSLLTVPTLAESSIDLASMSLDELIALREEVEAEIKEKGGAVEYDLSAGKYIVGVDIAPGSYVITAAEECDGTVTVYDSADDEEKGNFSVWETLSSGHSMRVILVEGGIMEIYNVQGTIARAPAIS